MNENFDFSLYMYFLKTLSDKIDVTTVSPFIVFMLSLFSFQLLFSVVYFIFLVLSTFTANKWLPKYMSNTVVTFQKEVVF